MRRRTLIATIGGFTFVTDAPGQVRAQVPTIGILEFGAIGKVLIGSFRNRLSELGYADGGNIRIEIYEALGDPNRLSDAARRMVASRVDVIVATGVQGAKAAREATAVIPIVMMHAADPVGAGLVSTLARPGGNVTGTSSSSDETVVKLVELVRELNPSVTRAAVLLNPANPSTAKWVKNAESAAERVGLQTLRVSAETERDLRVAFSAIEHSDAKGLVVLAEPFFTVHRGEIIGFAQAHRLTDVYAITTFAHDGGLAAYSPAFEQHWERGAELVVKILNGTKPFDLPVEEPTRFRLTINLKTAQALGITVPPFILARADEVIE